LQTKCALLCTWIDSLPALAQGANAAYLRYELDGNNLWCEELVPVKLTFRLGGSKDLTDIWCAAVRSAYFSSSGVSLASPMGINVKYSTYKKTPRPAM
jgi:hypothetical protein